MGDHGPDQRYGPIQMNRDSGAFLPRSGFKLFSTIAGPNLFSVAFVIMPVDGTTGTRRCVEEHLQTCTKPEFTCIFLPLRGNPTIIDRFMDDGSLSQYYLRSCRRQHRAVLQPPVSTHRAPLSPSSFITPPGRFTRLDDYGGNYAIEDVSIDRSVAPWHWHPVRPRVPKPIPYL